MKFCSALFLLSLLIISQPVQAQTGKPFELVVTPYKTTLVANGKDKAVIKIHATDRQGRQVNHPGCMLRITLSGAGSIQSISNGSGSSVPELQDGKYYKLLSGKECRVIIVAGNEPGYIKFTAEADSLWAGGTDIITVSPGSIKTVTAGKSKPVVTQPTTSLKMLGADISFLPELEAKGMKFYDNGTAKDAIQILKDHGFNYIRLRLFNDPSADSGYSPKLGFCDLPHTLQMAKRVKDAGLKLLLDFHYSDTWADPGKQYKPAAWKTLAFPELKQALYDYTRNVMLQLKNQGTLPDMVQVGNEINHGMVWPEGNVMNMDSLAQLIKAGTEAVRSVNPSAIMLLHLALGGQNAESVFFLDNMLKRNVSFDIIGLSYYPKWHGTLEDLKANMLDLVKRYRKDLVVVEYSQYKPEVNKLAFELPGCRGTCIWEPLNFWEKIFDEKGNANELIKVYDAVSTKYIRH